MEKSLAAVTEPKLFETFSSLSNGAIWPAF